MCKFVKRARFGPLGIKASVVSQMEVLLVRAQGSPIDLMAGCSDPEAVREYLRRGKEGDNAGDGIEVPPLPRADDD